MKEYFITVSDEYGNILYNKIFKAKNANSALSKAMKEIQFNYGHTIEILEEEI